MALRNDPTLAQGEEGEGILVCVSDATPTGKPRAIPLSELRAIQERVNPLQIRTERVLLASYDLDNLASTTAANTLPNSESFDDGYWLFEFHTNFGKVKVSAASFNASDANNRVLLKYANHVVETLLEIWHENATTFRLFVKRANQAPSDTQSANVGYLTAIYGEKLTLARKNDG